MYGAGLSEFPTAENQQLLHRLFDNLYGVTDAFNVSTLDFQSASVDLKIWQITMLAYMLVVFLRIFTRSGDSRW